MTTPAESVTRWDWLESAFDTGAVHEAGNAARQHVFAAVRADRDGLMTRRLLAGTTDPRVRVRRTTFDLLGVLSWPDAAWPMAADAARQALRDADPQVRRLAARVLVATAGLDQARSALDGSTDPVVRIALAEALSWPWGTRPEAVLDGLRSDAVPAVRLLAGLAAYRRDDPAAWPALDAAVRADLDAALDALHAPGARPVTTGQRWAHTLTGLDREDDCCAWAHRLTDPAAGPPVRLEGVRMAVVAMRQWRAAAGRLTPVLTVLLGEAPGVLRSAALHAVAASLTASRLAADDLAGLLDDAELGATAAVALGSIGDHRAAPRLSRLLRDGSDQPRLVEAFRVLARAGADPGAPVAAARQVPTSATERAMHVLIAFGPGAAPAVPDLLARLSGDGAAPGYEYRVLTAIGPAAAAAVPELRRREALVPLFWITRERAVAEQYLAGLPAALRRGRPAAAVLTWLAGHGGLTGRQHGQLRSLFDRPGSDQVAAAGALWRHEGPAVAAELLAVLPPYLSDDYYATEVLGVLTAMGVHARPVLDQLDDFVASRSRAGFSIGNEDVAMRADETLLDAMIAARALIAADPGAGVSGSPP